MIQNHRPNAMRLVNTTWCVLNFFPSFSSTIEMLMGIPALLRRSLRPVILISFLFSLPLIAMNRLAMHAEMSMDMAKLTSLTLMTLSITMGRQSHLALRTSLL